MGGGVHGVLAAASRLHSLLTSGGFLMSKQETPNAAPVAPNNRPPLITCGGETAIDLTPHFCPSDTLSRKPLNTRCVMFLTPSGVSEE